MCLIFGLGMGHWWDLFGFCSIILQHEPVILFWELGMRDNIINTNKPSSGRMYDYYLGGNHNFEVDRMAGDQVLKVVPFLKKFAKLQRWALQDIAEEFTLRRGYDVVIDFASGLPTADHIHNRVPQGTTVIYSDYDPVVVEYAQEILKDTPNVHFFENDISKPDELLNRPEVEKILAGRRKVAICIWGVAGFLFDHEISDAAKYLYNWAAPGSCLAFNAQTADLDLTDPAIIDMFRIYQGFGQEGHPRRLSEFNDLLAPWRIEETGWVSLLQWHGFGQSDMANDDVKAFGPMGGGYGAYLVK